MATKLLTWLLLSFVLVDVEVRAQSDVVLSWQVTTDDKVTIFNYTLEWFNQFHGCLCNRESKSCSLSSTSSEVKYVRSKGFNPNEDDQYNISNRFECMWEKANFASCTRLQNEVSNCSDVERCLSYHLISDQDSCDFEPYGILWVPDQNLTYWHNDSVLTINQCEPGCNISQTSSATTEPLVSSTSSVSYTQSSSTSQYLFSSLQTSASSPVSSTHTSLRPPVSSTQTSAIHPVYFSQTSTTSTVTSTAKFSSDTEDEDDAIIIIAVVVSIVAVLAVAVIFGLVLCRRKKAAKAKAARYRTGADADSNGNVGHSEHTNGRGASRATDLNNYSLATLSRDGNSSGQAVSVSDPYARVDLEKKHAARRSAVESTNNEEPQYSECNHHQNYSDIGPPVPLYNSSLNTAGGNTLEDGSSPKFGQNGKDSGNVSNEVSYSDIAISNTGFKRLTENIYSESGDVRGPSDNENPNGETSKLRNYSDDPQYSLARDVQPGTANVYSKLHDPVRNITNPYNDLMPDNGSVVNNANT